MTARVCAALAAVSLLLVSCLASPAPVSAADQAAMGDTDVQLWPGGLPGQAVAIISVTLPDSVELPAVVRIPVPAGTTVDWAGEVLADGNPSNDPERDFTIAAGTGGSYAEFEVTESRQAQVELSGTALEIDGATVRTQLSYVQSVPTSIVGFSVRLPAGVSDVRIGPAPAREPSINDAGETLYTLPSARLVPGAAQVVSVSYATGSDSAQPGGLAGDTLVGVLLALLAVAVLALVMALARQRRGA